MLFCAFPLHEVTFFRSMMFSVAHKRKVYLFFLSLSWKHKLPDTAIRVHHWCIQRTWNVIEFIFKVWLLWVLLQLCAGILRKTGFFIFVYWKSWYEHMSMLLGWSLILSGCSQMSYNYCEQEHIYRQLLHAGWWAWNLFPAKRGLYFCSFWFLLLLSQIKMTNS